MFNIRGNGSIIEASALAPRVANCCFEGRSEAFRGFGRAIASGGASSLECTLSIFCNRICSIQYMIYSVESLMQNI